MRWLAGIAGNSGLEFLIESCPVFALLLSSVRGGTTRFVCAIKGTLYLDREPLLLSNHILKSKPPQESETTWELIRVRAAEEGSLPRACIWTRQESCLRSSRTRDTGVALFIRPSCKSHN